VDARHHEYAGGADLTSIIGKSPLGHMADIANSPIESAIDGKANIAQATPTGQNWRKG
jgi:hypothetical protein